MISKSRNSGELHINPSTILSPDNRTGKVCGVGMMTWRALLGIRVWRGAMMQRVRLADGSTVHGLNIIETWILYHEMFSNQPYIDHGIELREGDCVLDVGANIGMFTRYIYARCNGKLTVYAFEPVPEIFETLRRNTQLDRRHLHALNFGLSNGEKTVEFEYIPRLSIWSSAKHGLYMDRVQRWWLDADAIASIVRSATGRFLLKWAVRFFLRHITRKVRHVKCVLKPLSEAIREKRIDTIHLLKIDVEGCEIEVLNGIEEVHWPKIRQVAMEIETFCDLRRATKILEDHGFRVESEATERKLGAQHSEVSHLWARRI